MRYHRFYRYQYAAALSYESFCCVGKACQIVNGIRCTHVRNPQMVRLLLFVADTALNNRNEERTHACVHAHAHTWSDNKVRELIAVNCYIPH